MKTREELITREKECNYEIETLRNQIKGLESELDDLENLKQYPIVKTAKHGEKFQIILFTAPNIGMNINSIGWPHGYTSEGWDEKSFKPFTGIIEYKDGLSVPDRDQEWRIHENIGYLEETSSRSYKET